MKDFKRFKSEIPAPLGYRVWEAFRVYQVGISAGRPGRRPIIPRFVGSKRSPRSHSGAPKGGRINFRKGVGMGCRPVGVLFTVALYSLVTYNHRSGNRALFQQVGGMDHMGLFIVPGD